MNKVDVKYNPYLPELTVLINNKPLSKYSSIMSYKHKPFIEWCSSFFDRINSEVNDAYELRFTATEFENEIFETLASKNTNCTHYEYRHIEDGRDVLSRLHELQRLGDNNKSTELKVGIWAEDKRFIQAVIELLIDSGEYFENDYGVLSSCQVPLVNILINKTEFVEELLEEDIAIVLTQGDLREESFNHLQRLGKSVFLINLTDDACFYGKKLNVFCYHIEGDDVIACIEKIIEGAALPQILSDREYRLEQIASNNGISALPDVSEKLELVCAIERMYHLSFPPKTFVGRTTTASIKVVPKPNAEPHYSLISQNGLVIIDGMEVEAISSGEDVLELYVDDKTLPVTSCNLLITDDNYISEISFDSNIYNIAVGDSKKLNYSCYPEDSVNEEELQWESSDTDIAVIRKGEVEGKKPGKASVVLKTKEASASITVNVLPHVERIESTSNHIVVEEGDKKAWSYKLIPGESFGDETECFEKGSERINSSNEKVAIYKGGYIEGKSTGDATIYITIPGSDLRNQCRVSVKKKGSL